MELKTGMISVGEFNSLYTNGEIFPYKNNRGGNTHNLTRVKKYAASWDTAASGCAVVEKVSEGYMLRDFHNRAEAIKLGISSGSISPKEIILIRVIPPGDGLQAYKKINAALKHSSVEKFKNIDLCFGHEIAKILTHVKNPDLIPAKFYQQMSYAILDLRIKKRSEYVLTSGNHSVVSRYIDSSIVESKELSLTLPQGKLIANAINFWCTIRDEAFSQKDSKLLEKIFRSAQLFGFTVYDHLFQRKLGDVSKVTKKILLNQRKVEDNIKRLTLGAMSDRLETEKALISMLS